jgi:hypothetical protein
MLKIAKTCMTEIHLKTKVSNGFVKHGVFFIIRSMKLTRIIDLFKNSVRTLKKTQYFTTLNIKLLMLFILRIARNP